MAQCIEERSITREQIKERIRTLLESLVPGSDLARVADDANLREALAADSMDTLNFVTALHTRFGVDIPEQDYGQIDTLDRCAEYIHARVATAEK